jgi:hypothetical protein
MMVWNAEKKYISCYLLVPGFAEGLRSIKDRNVKE